MLASVGVSEGTALSTDEAIAYAQRGRGSPRVLRLPPADWSDALT